MRLPIIYQLRKAVEFVSLDNLTDENVFNRKQFLYGIDNRANAGFGHWQFTFGSKADLTPANYELLRTAMETQYRRNGLTLGAMATHLVYHPSLEGAARTLINAELVESNGAAVSNIWAGSVTGFKARNLPAAA